MNGKERFYAVIGRRKHGGLLQVYDKHGKSSANMSVNENGRVVNVKGKSTESLSLNFKRESVEVDED